MAITLPSYYRFVQNRLSAVYNEYIVEDTLLALRDNNHYLYANHNIKTTISLAWSNGLKTSSSSSEIVLEFPFVFSPNRKNTGLRFLWSRTGTCTLTILVRDAADTTTYATLGPATSGAGDSTSTLTSGITDDEVLIRVLLACPSGTEGLDYLIVAELPLDLTNLP